MIKVQGQGINARQIILHLAQGNLDAEGLLEFLSGLGNEQGIEAHLHEGNRGAEVGLGQAGKIANEVAQLDHETVFAAGRSGWDRSCSRHRIDIDIWERVTSAGASGFVTESGNGTEDSGD